MGSSAERPPGEAPARQVADLRMTRFDRLLQRWRLAKVAPYVTPGARVLDVGSADGALFRRFGERIAHGIGIDSGLEACVAGERWKLVAGWFPDDLPEAGSFDLIALLAVLEHLPAGEQRAVARECAQRLSPGGHVVITVPSKLVDPIVQALVALRVMRAVGFEQHHGYDPARTPELFCSAGLELVRRERFQLGLNNLFVFRKRAA